MKSEVEEEKVLDITPLKKAAEAYSNALAYVGKVESKKPEEIVFYEFEAARAALIQHFEFSYELCWKFMKRFIEMDMGNDADIISRKDLFRISAGMRLIADFDIWIKYTRDRNRTSHVYDEDVANEVFETAKRFFHEFRNFVETMEKRI